MGKTESYECENGTEFFFIRSDFKQDYDKIMIKSGNSTIIIDAKDILEFVAINYIAAERVNGLRSMTWEEILDDSIKASG